MPLLQNDYICSSACYEMMTLTERPSLSVWFSACSLHFWKKRTACLLSKKAVLALPSPAVKRNRKTELPDEWQLGFPLVYYMKEGLGVNAMGSFSTVCLDVLIRCSDSAKTKIVNKHRQHTF